MGGDTPPVAGSTNCPAWAAMVEGARRLLSGFGSVMLFGLFSIAAGRNAY